MFIDSHCHLPHHRYTKTVAQIIGDAQQAGVTGIVAIGTSFKENHLAIKVAEANQPVYCSIGIHIDEDKDKTIPELKAALSKQLGLTRKIVAIGECGIDVSEWTGSRPLIDQVALFEMQIQLALEHNLPVIIHNRNGDEAVLALLKQYVPLGLRAIAHSFSQSWEYARSLLDFGVYISFSGMITYRGRRAILETVKNMPADRILIETDAPYLPPEGFRGQPNEPKNVVAVARKIADTRGDDYDNLAVKIYENTKTILKLN